MALRRAGNVAKAREISHGLLSSLPDDTDVLLFAGQIELQAGAPELALRLLDRALALQPSLAPAHYARGIALQSVNRLGDALQSYTSVLALEPAHAMTHYNMGVLLQGMGRNEEAAQSYGAAAQAQPDYGDALFNLGVVLNLLGRFGEAADAFDKLLKQAPRDPQAWFNSGLAHYWNGNFERSLAAIDQALSLAPRSPDARCARAMVLEALGRPDDAARDYEQAFAGGFKDAQAFNRYGNLLLGLGRTSDAVRALSIAAELAPDVADILNSRGVALGQLGEAKLALVDFRKALALKPDLIEAASNAADSAVRLGLADEALSFFRQALNFPALTPSEKQARDNALGSNIFFRRQLCLWDELGELERDAAERVRNDGASLDPFKAVTFWDDLGLHKLCADRAAAAGPAIAAMTRAAPARRSGKLRIGYLSADFHDHATTRLMAELFELHDRSRFDVVAYSYGRDDGSAMRKRVVAAFDNFNDIATSSDHQIAEKIAADDVHLLIDLKGRTREARLGILKYRPAPVAAHYIGFPGTIGGGLVDYMIADAVTVPFEQAAHYSEAIVHLPHCYQVNDRHRSVAETPTRSSCGLPDNAFVLCGFAQPFKLSPEVLDVWARILTQVPGSVLWMLAYNDEMQANVRREVEARGIAAERLIFAAPADLPEHLARQKLADLYLDTWPYGAHTSASDALWVGLPVVTSPGGSFASRVSASLLESIRAPELIAASADDYAEIAVRLARAPAELAALRRKLEHNRGTAPLFDTDLFRRGIEAAYLQMWEIFERGEKPRHFAVDAS